MGAGVAQITQSAAIGNMTGAAATAGASTTATGGNYLQNMGIAVVTAGVTGNITNPAARFGASAILGGIGSELTGGDFWEGAGIAAMNTVVIMAIEHTMSSRVKTGAESEKNANSDMNTNKGSEAGKQTKPYVLLAQAGYFNGDPYDPTFIPIEPAQQLTKEQIRNEELKWEIVKRGVEEIADNVFDKIIAPASIRFMFNRDAIEKGMERIFPRNAEACPKR